jgi:hypothetical protein
MAMSNVNNKQKAKKQTSARNRQAMTNHLNGEFGAESNFDTKQFKKDREFSTEEKPVSERTLWN